MAPSGCHFTFAQEAKSIVKDYYNLMNNNALPKNTQKLSDLQASLGKLKEKAQTDASSLWSWFHGETQAFLNEWPGIIDKLKANVDSVLTSGMENHATSDELLSDGENEQFVSQQQAVNPIENTAQIAEIRQENSAIRMETAQIQERNLDIDKKNARTDKENAQIEAENTKIASENERLETLIENINDEIRPN